MHPGGFTVCLWKAEVEEVPLVEFMYLVFTRMPGESYHRWLGSLLLYLRYVFQVLINSPVCWFWKAKKKKWAHDVIMHLCHTCWPCSWHQRHSARHKMAVPVVVFYLNRFSRSGAKPWYWHRHKSRQTNRNFKKSIYKIHSHVLFTSTFHTIFSSLAHNCHSKAELLLCVRTTSVIPHT